MWCISEPTSAYMAVSILFCYARRGSGNHHANILHFQLSLDLSTFRKETTCSMLLKCAMTKICDVYWSLPKFRLSTRIADLSWCCPEVANSSIPPPRIDSLNSSISSDALSILTLRYLSSDALSIPQPFHNEIKRKKGHVCVVPAFERNVIAGTK